MTVLRQIVSSYTFGLAVFAAGAVSVPAAAETIFVDFGVTGETTSATGWNNFTSLTSGTTEENLASDQGTTAIDLTLQLSSNDLGGVGGSGFGSTAPTSGPTGLAGFPDSATKDVFFASNTNDTAFAEFVLSDLALDGTNYTLSFLASLDVDSRDPTIFTVLRDSGDLVESISPASNSTLVVFDDILPDANGEIVFRFSEGNPTGTNDDGAVLNLMRVDVNPIPEPASLALMGLGGLLMLKRQRQISTSIG